MISYSEYKIKEAAEAPQTAPPPPADAQSLPSPAGLPSPSTGSPPDASVPDLGMSSPPGGLDSMMGAPSGPVSNSPPKSLDLKYSNVWDAFEKFLKSLKVDK